MKVRQGRLAVSRSWALWPLLALCACQTSIVPGAASSFEPTRSADVSVPDDAREQAGGRNRTPGRPRSIDLAEVLSLVERQGLDLRIARERWRAAQAAADTARATWYPRVVVGTGLTRTEGRVQATDGALLNVDKQSIYGDVGLSFELNLGEAIYGTRAAEHRELASEFDMLAERGDSITLAAHYYFDLAETSARIPIAEEAGEHAAQLVTLSQARFDVGAGLAVDLARARAHEARARRALIGARTEARIASGLLIELLQLDPFIPLEPRDGSDQLPARIDMGGRRSDVPFGETRPELGRAAAELEARRAEEEQAEWDWLLPDLLVSARYGYLGDTVGNIKDREGYVAGFRWDLGADLFSERERSRSRRRIAELVAARTLAAVAQEINTAEAELEAAELALQVATYEVSAATQALELATARHAQGAGLLIEVLEAQIAASRARVSELAAVVGINRAEFSLSRAVGLAANQMLP